MLAAISPTTCLSIPDDFDVGLVGALEGDAFWSFDFDGVTETDVQDELLALHLSAVTNTDDFKLLLKAFAHTP